MDTGMGQSRDSGMMYGGMWWYANQTRALGVIRDSCRSGVVS
jgi:hypothetical protein